MIDHEVGWLFHGCTSCLVKGKRKSRCCFNEQDLLLMMIEDKLLDNRHVSCLVKRSAKAIQVKIEVNASKPSTKTLNHSLCVWFFAHNIISCHFLCAWILFIAALNLSVPYCSCLGLGSWLVATVDGNRWRVPVTNAYLVN